MKMLEESAPPNPEKTNPVVKKSDVAEVTDLIEQAMLKVEEPKDQLLVPPSPLHNIGTDRNEVAIIPIGSPASLAD